MIAFKNTKRKCSEDISKIENYDKAIADKSQTWDCHHRREIQDGYVIWTVEELEKIGQYYNRPADELIFLTPSEHHTLHNNAILPNGKKYIAHYGDNNWSRSEEARKFLSENIKGDKNPMYGMTGDKNPMFGHSCTEYMTEEKIKKWKENISKATSGENNPMYGKDAWAIACSRKTPEQIEATRKSKSEKMKKWHEQRRKEKEAHGHGYRS